MQTDLIVISEYCQKSHIDPVFIEMLSEGGLIDILEEENEHYLFTSQLNDLERYSRLYYDLAINMEGIDAIRNLLERIEDMQQEIRFLKRQLTLYVPAVHGYLE